MPRGWWLAAGVPQELIALGEPLQRPLLADLTLRAATAGVLSFDAMTLALVLHRLLHPL